MFGFFRFLLPAGLKGGRAMSEAALAPPISFYVWAPVELLGPCQSFLGGSGYCLRKPPLPHEEWKRVDSLFGQMWVAADKKVVVVLCEGSAERTAHFLYVYLEPLANVVIGLGYAEKNVSISSDGTLWWVHDRLLKALTGEAQRLLQQGEIVEALLFSIERLYRILQEPPRTLMGQQTPRRE
jgi:hypothetical protein